jgi:hypothetical protein
VWLAYYVFVLGEMLDTSADDKEVTNNACAMAIGGICLWIGNFLSHIVFSIFLPQFSKMLNKASRQSQLLQIIGVHPVIQQEVVTKSLPHFSSLTEVISRTSVSSHSCTNVAM